MSHTYTNLLSHIVFSTKDRQPLIDSELKPRLVGYMNGIAIENGGKVLSLNANARSRSSPLGVAANILNVRCVESFENEFVSVGSRDIRSS